jgi:hypothetical protein
MRPPNVTPVEHAAFKAELATLRRMVKDVRHKRLRYIPWQRPNLQDVHDWKNTNNAVLQRLDFWESVLIPDSTTREIRSPVRLWDALNRVRLTAEINEIELNDHIEYYAGKDRQNSRQEAP